MISLSERSNEIVNFIEDEVYIPDEIQKQLLEFMTKICSYEEEEKKIFPHLVIGQNIETEDFRKIFSVEIIHLSTEKNRSEGAHV